jgi:hypothetical protein
MLTGEMRSGTTLLANLLHSQERITAFRDFLHIARLYEGLNLPSLAYPLSPAKREKLLEHFNQHNEQLGVEIGVKFDLRDFENLLEFYISVLEQIAEPTDVVVGHKTTVAHHVVRELLTLLPDFRILYLIRDPRDVVTSAVKNFPKKSPYRFIESWKDAWTTINALKHQTDLASRLLVVHYENLLIDTDRTLADIESFIGHPRIVIPDTMMDYSQEWQDNSSFGDINKVLDPAPIGRWRERNPRIGRIAEALLHEHMESAGYEVAQPIDKRLRFSAQFRRTLYQLFERPLGY